MALSVENNFTNYSGTFPTAIAVNATGAGTADGTEFVKLMVDNWLFGPQQALLDRAGLTPDEVTESATASQTIDAIKKGFGIGPGTVMMYHFNNTFTALGYRIIPLNGQGIDRTLADYVELDAICYVGDANNTAVAAAGGAYFRSTTADGLNPSATGQYLILPESRGYTVRGLDIAASVDPLGASRFLGDNQVDAFQGHRHGVISNIGSYSHAFVRQEGADSADAINIESSIGTLVGNLAVGDPQTDSVNGVPRTSSETRMVNFSVNFGVVY